MKFKEGTCDIEGCNFCLSDDVCMMCRDGFEFGKNSTDSTNSTC